jgi:chemotaxis family two-component system response regulator Rcp1
MAAETLKRSRPSRVVVVEDSKSDAQLIVEGLKLGGRNLNILLISDGEKASNYFEEEEEPTFAPFGRPDLIMLDLDLPKKSGAELITEIKAIAGLSEVPVVVLSGSTRSEEVWGCYDLGASSVVQKPPEAESFVGLVQAVVHYWLDIVGTSPV